ncbi:MAG: hypothetical protein P8X39_00540 [Desulfofustis sp.]|jgi:hypothetical protein
MKTVRKLKFLVFVYLGVLVFILLLVIVTPLIIRYGVSITQEFIIEEDIIETSLIIILLGISYIIFRGFKKALRAYERKILISGEENSRLVSRLTDASSYIGTMNVEFQEVQAILCGVERYPETKNELRRYMDHLVVKSMTVAGTPWAVVRIISRSNGQTKKEYAAVRPHRVLPSATMGNREILEDSQSERLKVIGSRQKNLDLLTVCILPEGDFSEAEIVLIRAIITQIELFYLLYRSGFIQQQFSIDHNGQ